MTNGHDAVIERLARLEVQIIAERELSVAKFLQVAALAEKHNDLLSAMQKRDEKYLLKAEWDRTHGDTVRRLTRLETEIASFPGHYLTVERYGERHEALVHTVSVNENRIAALEAGNQIKAATIGWGLLALGILITVVIAIVEHAIK